MTLPTEWNTELSRGAALAKARQSRRPSRLGLRAGTASQPDSQRVEDAGFPVLLTQTWRQAMAAPGPLEAVDALLTLDGHVPADIQLRALTVEDECAIKVLFGRSWRTGSENPTPTDGTTAFMGEIGLNTSGRVVVRVPSRGPLREEEKLVGGILRVPWSRSTLSAYQVELNNALSQWRESIADCRAWLAATGAGGRRDMLEVLKEAALRTAPFILYSGTRQYTNFRERNTLTGKTLWPGHPDCALSSLATIPLELWSDYDVQLVAGLTLLTRSAGFARIEEANGTQLSVAHVACLLERTRVTYNSISGGPQVERASSPSIADLTKLAVTLSRRRQAISEKSQLYREIHGPLMHKVERVAAAFSSDRREAELCARLRERLPVSGDTLSELRASIAKASGWLAHSHSEFATGLESLIYESVHASAAVFNADFAMSRGMRSLPALIEALRANELSKIAAWEIPHFFCCVVPGLNARRHFNDSFSSLADTAWAMSARMQYNSWHFLAGNLPRIPATAMRDYFVPPTIPDIAYYADQHHRGHVAAKVRFSIRCPQTVVILDRRFDGFVDLRLLRCQGPPFDERDLLTAHRASALIAEATTLAATLVAGGTQIEVTKFDSQWHWEKIAHQAALQDHACPDAVPES